MSERVDELETHLVAPISSHARHGAQVYPQQRVTNLGRRIGVDQAAEPERLVFTHRDSVVAELLSPSNPAGAADGSLLGWRLTFPSSSDHILAAPAGRPPIKTALFLVDMVLGDQG